MKEVENKYTGSFLLDLKISFDKTNGIGEVGQESLMTNGYSMKKRKLC